MVERRVIAVDSSRIALVHDYMTQVGGAERVAGIMAGALPSARLLTSMHRQRDVPLDLIGGRPWQTSFLQRFAGRVPYKALLPLLPRAMSSLDVGDCDLVISSSSAFAHYVRVPESATHLCYCAAPAHFLWNSGEYFRGREWLRLALAPLLGWLRRKDREAASRVDGYIANSHYTASRIRAVYGREASVIYPPVETARFQPTRERSGRFLVVSRLVPTKRVDLAVEAANRYELPLDIIGSGPELRRLRRMAGPTVRIHGWLPDAEVRRAMAECVAVVVPGTEDFGLVTAEAQASGRPPVAFATGGATEIVRDGVTGVLFGRQTPEALAEAMLRARDTAWDTDALLESAARFDTAKFLDALEAAIAGALPDNRRGVTEAAGAAS